jgi:chemotaxis protein MotB
MGKHDVPEDPPQSAPEWIVTFSDMISLLVTFFVMLMSFSTIEDAEKAVIVGAFGRNAGGLLDPGPNSAVAPPRDRMAASNPIRGADRPHARPPEELPENLEEMGQKKTDEHVEVDFSAVTDGLLVTFDERASFAPGSAEPNPMLRRSLADLGEVLSHYSHLVVVEGHTDDQFVATQRHPTAEALSAARAAAAAAAMSDESDMARDLLQIAAHGARAPRVPNDSAAGRTINRRVQVRVLALSKARARSLQREFEARAGEER